MDANLFTPIAILPLSIARQLQISRYLGMMSLVVRARVCHIGGDSQDKLPLGIWLGDPLKHGFGHQLAHESQNH